MSLVNAILMKARDLAVLKNDSAARRRDQGVLFARYADQDGHLKSEAWLISEIAMIRWSNMAGDLDFPDDFPWFSFSEDRFTENTSSMKTIDDVRNLYMDITAGNKEMFKLPVNTTLRMIDSAFSEREGRFLQIERSRTIIRNNAGYVFENEILLQMRGGQLVNPSLKDYAFQIAESSIIKSFTDGTIYRANILSVNNDLFGGKIATVEVRDIYYKNMIEVLCHEVTKGVLFHKTDREFIDSSYYDKSRVLRLPYVVQPPEGGYKFQPIHLDTTALFYIFRAFEDYNVANTYVGEGVTPVIFHADEPTVEGLPMVEAIIAVIIPNIRGYYK